MGLREKLNYFVERQKFNFSVENHLNNSRNPRVELDFGKECERVEILSCDGRVDIGDVTETIKWMGDIDGTISVVVKEKTNDVLIGRTVFPKK